MSKTIEIASIHKGKITTKVRGASVVVNFEDRGGVGIALCDHDEAAAFMAIGRPDYWKPGCKDSDYVTGTINSMAETAGITNNDMPIESEKITKAEQAAINFAKRGKK